MANFTTPPNYDLIAGDDGKASKSYVLFFNNIVQGDPGEAWSPAFTGLTTVGTVNISGLYYVMTNSLAYFRVVIAPTTGATSASTAGTTFINNFPLHILAPSVFGVVAGNANAGLGTTNASNNSIYTPTWSASNGQFILSGVVEAS